MGWRSILTLVLLAAAVLSGWSVWRQRAPDAPRGPASGRSEYTLIDFELISLDEQGRESFTLRAPHLARTPGKRTLEMKSPLFLFPVRGDDNTVYWEMRSEQGWVSAEGDEVRLTGNVHATGPDSSGTPSSLKTAQLNIFPKTERASSPVHVVLRNGPSIIQSGTGLRMDLASRHYTLLSDVEFHYDPSH